MTSLAVNYGWTPELIAQDKALKEKYGQGAHIIPAKTYVGLTNVENDSVEIDAKKDDKKVASPLIKGGLALGGAYGVKKMVPHIFDKVSKFLKPKIKLIFPKGSCIGTVIFIDNGKPLKWIRDALTKADKKLFEGTSKFSKFLETQFTNKGYAIPAERIAVIAKNCAKIAGVGLAVYGGYQLIKGIANAISNAKNS